MEHNGPMGDSDGMTVAKKIHVIGEAMGGLVGEELMSLADSVLQFEPPLPQTFNLDDFIDAATGAPASEVVGGPGHYRLSPRPEVDASGVLGEDQGDARDQLYPPVEENFWDDRTMASDDRPSANELLTRAMTQAHDPTERSVTIPVKKLMEVKVEIGNIERKAQANGQLCMEKTRELVQTRAELSHLQQAMNVGHAVIDRVNQLFSLRPDSSCRTLWRDGVECVEVPLAELQEALKVQPTPDETMGQGFLADMNDPQSLILRVPTTEELKLQQES